MRVMQVIEVVAALIWDRDQVFNLSASRIFYHNREVTKNK